MLVLQRQINEEIMIGDNISIIIIDIRRGEKVRLGIVAPQNMPVHRKEVYDAINRENMAHKKKYKGFTDEAGSLLQIAYFDGYDFGDRILEGIVFKASVINGRLTVEFNNPDGKYEQGLNQAKWVKDALKYAEDPKTTFWPNPSFPSLTGDLVLTER